MLFPFIVVNADGDGDDKKKLEFQVPPTAKWHLKTEVYGKM